MNLVDHNGRVQTGIFPQSLDHINGRDFDYRTPMGSPQNPLAKHFHYKQFQYFGMLSDSCLAGCAFAHTGYIGLVFVYVYDTATRKMVSETFRMPLARGLSMSESPVAGESVLETRGAKIRMGYVRLRDGTLEKSLKVETAKGLKIDAVMREAPPFEVLALCTQTGINGWTYANKVAGISVTGHIESALGRIDLATAKACGHHDFSAGYMRRETFWNWACFSGHAGGHVLGLNMSCGVNETGHSENCIWVDGKRIPVGLAQFNFDRNNPDSLWHLTTSDGSIDLTVTPAGLHAERMNLGLFATNFKQFFGRFAGTVRAGDKTIVIDNLWGFVEDQYAKW